MGLLLVLLQSSFLLLLLFGGVKDLENNVGRSTFPSVFEFAAILLAGWADRIIGSFMIWQMGCLLYTSPSPRD